MREGRDLTLISTGGLLATAVAAAEQLATHGLSTRVLSMHTVKPLDSEAVLRAATETRAIATLEEHSIVGGLGSAVAEVLADSGSLTVPVARIGVDSAFAPVAGDQEFLRNLFGLSSEAVVQRLLKLVAREHP